jgi:muconolactone D-isomerase
MRFHVDIIPDFPHDWSPEKLTDMLAQETEAAVNLMARGILLRIDRVVGRGGNVSLWETESLEQLDEVIKALPMAPFIKVSVTPLTKHRVQIAYEESLRGGAAASRQ